MPHLLKPVFSNGLLSCLSQLPSEFPLQMPSKLSIACPGFGIFLTKLFSSEEERDIMSDTFLVKVP